MERVICNQDCKSCVLSNSVQREAVCIMNEPDRHYPIMIIGDRPSVNDTKNRTVMDSRFLNIVLDKVVGIPADMIYRTYAMKCGVTVADVPLGNTNSCVDQYLAEEIFKIKPKVIIVFGEQVMNSVLGLTGVTKHRGKWVTKVFGDVIQGNEFEVMVMPTYSPGFVERMDTHVKAFAEDIQIAYHEAIGYVKEEGKSKMVLCDTIDKVNELMDYIEQVGKASFDFETTGLNYWDYKSIGEDGKPKFYVTCLSFSFQAGSSYVIPLYHQEPVFDGKKLKEYLPPIFTPEQVQIIVEILKVRFFGNRNVHKVGHNIKYDLHCARTMGIHEFLGRHTDTMLMSHVYNGRVKHGLKELQGVYYPEFTGYEDQTKKYKWNAMPAKILFPYSGVDTDVTLRFSVQFENFLMQDDRSYILYRNLTMPTMFALERAEWNGMLIDRDFTLTAIAEVQEIIKNHILGLKKHKQIKRFEDSKREEYTTNALTELNQKLHDALSKGGASYEKKRDTKLESLHKKLEKMQEKNDLVKVSEIMQEIETLKNEVPEIDTAAIKKLKEKITDIKIGKVQAYEGINFSSHVQMKELIYGPMGFGFKKIKDRWGKEQDGTGKEILEDLTDPSGFLDGLLTLRSLEKMLGTYIEGIWDRVDDNCYVHTSLKQIGTYTGRLSSEEPNLQNIPKMGKLKDEVSKNVVGKVMKMFSVPEGHTLIQGDLSQAELRIVAEYANETNMLDAYARKIDLHKKTGSAVAGITIEQFDQLEKDKAKKIRNDAKPVNFGYVYGQSAEGFVDYAKGSYGIRYDIETARKMRDAYFREYPMLLQYHEIYKAKARQFGCVRTFFGRRIDMSDIHSMDNMARGEAERQAINCVTDDTEILTLTGWKKLSDLVEGESVLSVNSNTGAVEIDVLLKINQNQVSDHEMIQIENNAISCISTNNHRWLVEKKCRKGTNTGFVESQKLSRHGDHRIWLSGSYSDFSGNQNWTDDEVEIIGWVLTDGSYPRWKGKHYTVGITQSKKQNIEYIKDLCNRLGPHSYYITKAGQHCWKLRTNFGKKVILAMPDKTLNMKFLASLSTKQLHLLYKAMLMGDGCFDNHSGRYRKFCAGSKDRAEAFLMLCVMIGKPANMYYRDMSKYTPKLSIKMKNIPKTNGIWLVELKNRRLAYASINKTVVQYSGKVWCPTTHNGTWVAKRNGKIFVTGNSPIQGTVGEWVLFGIAILQHRIDSRVIFVNTVHDSIVLYCPDELVADTIRILRDTLQNLPTLLYFGKQLKKVGMVVDCEISKKSWKELEPFA